MTGNTISRRAVVAGATAGFIFAPSALAAARMRQGEVSDRVEAFIAKMTLEEKAGQLSCYADPVRPFGQVINPASGAERGRLQMLEEIRKGRVGSLLGGSGAAGAKAIQDAAMQSRMQIPLLLAADVIHGYITGFPIPLAEASAFDPDLAERTARAAAKEAYAYGLHWTYAPMVDIARDERWGRVAEGSGEDPCLGQALAAARVRGFQGKDLKADGSLLATAKHFVAYGAVTAGLDYNTVEMSEATLREIHLPPFKAAIDAGALAVMSSFNDLNGVPMTANKRLITDILRGELGFKGVVISDYTADWELIRHGYAADERDAARLAILAGVDISMASGLYIKHLPALVRSGAVPIEVVNASVRRVLQLKETLGMFDKPYRGIDPGAAVRETATPELRKLAREAAVKSIVLLKNENGILPLPRSGKRIALIGPFAEDRDNLPGPWAPWADVSLGIDLATGLRQALGDPSLLHVSVGCGIEEAIPGGMEAAVSTASAADLVLLAVGEGQGMSGEAQSRTTITLPAVQKTLVERIMALGKPVVVLLRHGRAVALEGAEKDASAILATWFLGCETGHAVADVLFGLVNPSGRLPVSFPVESGQEPYYYDHRSTGRPAPEAANDQAFKARWRSTRNQALFPFGYGLSYTNFVLSNLVLSANQLNWSDTLVVAADVENLGTLAGEHVVQLYLHDRVASRTRPVRELKGFQRIALKAGEKRRVEFRITREDLQFVGNDNHWTVEPGWFDVWVANHSADGLKGEFLLKPNDARLVQN